MFGVLDGMFGVQGGVFVTHDGVFDVAAVTSAATALGELGTR
ncbi:hypothetical protein [Haloechinothrix halophila]|nr:hypothetical protein [Haloechinothrix halophila]